MGSRKNNLYKKVERVTGLQAVQEYFIYEMKNSIYFLLLFIAMIAAAVFVDWIRQHYGLPVTLLDIICNLTMLYGMYFFTRNTFFNKNGERLIDEFRSMSLLGNGFMFVLAIFIWLLGLLSLRQGFSTPLEFITGARGAMHGYTLGPLGIFLISLSTIVVLGVSNAIRHIHHKTK